MNAEQLAAKLGAARSGRQFKCRCVVHEDRDPSMIIFDGRQNVQVRCMAGCEPRDIIAVLTARGLWEGGRVQDTENMRPTVSHETEKRRREIERLRELAR